MEDYPKQKYALLTVIAVQESSIQVTDADGTPYHAHCVPRQAERLRVLTTSRPAIWP